MSEKIARLGIERDNDKMYYIKGGDVWATPRKQPGKPKGKPQKIVATGIDLDYSRYLYFIDGDGDVARKARASGGGGRTKAPKAPRKTPRSSISGHYVTEATAKRHPRTTVEETSKPGRKKTVAQLEREIAECLAQNKGASSGGNGGTKNGNGGNGGAKNGNGGNGVAAKKKKKKARR